MDERTIIRSKNATRWHAATSISYLSDRTAGTTLCGKSFERVIAGRGRDAINRIDCKLCREAMKIQRREIE